MNAQRPGQAFRKAPRPQVKSIPDNILSDDCTIEELICFQELYRKGEENLDRHERKRLLALTLKLFGSDETTILLPIESNADEECM